jgi:N-acetylneuraminic acid mutarotase
MDGRIYAVGGRNLTPVWVRDVTVYDPSTGIWSELAPMPTGRYNLAAAVAIDGRIYAMGGFADFQYTRAVEVYDPSNNQWATAPSMRAAREGLGGARGADDRIYAIGGLIVKDYFHRGVLTTVEAYTP